jgi:hypothetical protein
MDYRQDPQKQIAYLQQCFSSSKKPLGLFLGAGCPMGVRVGGQDKQPLIPDIAGITREVRKSISGSQDYDRLLKTVDDHFKKDNRNDVNVEGILSHIRSLHIVAGNDEVRGLSSQDLDKLDNKICDLIYELANKQLPNIDSPYHRVALWVDGVERDVPVEIFTTNYDLLMEQALEDKQVPYFDGFAGVRKPFFDLRTMEEDSLPSRWTRLWKLHGSINWYQMEKEGVFRGSANETGLKRVIHPSHLKYAESRRMPYLAMIDRLRAFLRKPTSTLVLCGYSFRDEHLNEAIVQGLQGTQTAIAFALLFDNLDKYQDAIKLAVRRQNLSLLARDGAVISGRKIMWSEKDADVVASAPAKWATWIPVDPANASGKQVARFMLGDFAVFGEFLDELIGGAHQSMENSDA